jgi:hypothetical protein
MFKEPILFEPGNKFTLVESPDKGYHATSGAGGRRQSGMLVFRNSLWDQNNNTELAGQFKAFLVCESL